MYKNNEELFKKNDKLLLMLDSKQSGKVFFPDKYNPKLVCSIDSPLAIGCATILKAGFNINHESFKLIPSDNEKSVNVMFGDKIIQTIHFETLNGQPVHKTIKKIKLNPHADKNTILLLDMSVFLNRENGFKSFLETLPLDINEGETQKVETIRETHLSSAGFHIEEYEKTTLLDPDDDINLDLLNHHFTFSNPIIFNSLDSNKEDKLISDNLKFLNTNGVLEDNITFKVDLNSLINIPNESYNPIINVSNYRDLNFKQITEKFDDFIFDLVVKCKDYNDIDSNLDYEFMPIVKKTLKDRLLLDFGKEKELFSLKNSKYKTQKEIFVYKQDNEICINSKGTCLGDGQHSTATFIILNEVFNNTDKCHISLMQKFGWSSSEFNSEFGNSVEGLKQNILLQLEKSGLSEEQFKLFLSKYKIELNWDISQNQKELSQKIKTSNKITQQDSSNDWINSYKEFVDKFISKANKYNSVINEKFKALDNPISLELASIKTASNTSGVTLHTMKANKLNEVFGYLSFFLPNGKFVSTYEKEYNPIKPDGKKAVGQLPNIYQSLVLDTEQDHLWSLFDNGFKSSKSSSSTIVDFFSWFEKDFHLKTNSNISKKIKNEKFIEIGKTSFNNFSTDLKEEFIFKKIPVVLLMIKKAEDFYITHCQKLKEIKAINIDNFKKLYFMSTVSKIGKNNVTLDNFENYGELILKDIFNSLNDYYINKHSTDIQLTDEMKRDRGNISKIDHKFNDKRKLMLELFEPLQNNLLKSEQNRKSEFLFTKFKSWKDNLETRTKEIEFKFSNFTGTKLKM